MLLCLTCHCRQKQAIDGLNVDDISADDIVSNSSNFTNYRKAATPLKTFCIILSVYLNVISQLTAGPSTLNCLIIMLSRLGHHLNVQINLKN